MNFTSLEHINGLINDGAIYWTLRDKSGAGILAEQINAMPAADSYERLTKALNNQRGEYVKLTLSQRAPHEKGAGGSVKNYGPFNIEVQSAVNLPAVINGPANNYGGRDHYNEWLIERDKRQALEMEILRRDLDANNNKLLEKYAPAILGLLNNWIEPKQQVNAKINEPEQINGAPFTFQVNDELTAKNLTTLASKPKFAEVLNALVAGGDDAWNSVLMFAKV